MITLTSTAAPEQDPAPAIADTAGMTERQARRALLEEEMKVKELRLVQIYEDGKCLGSLRDCLANYPARRAEFRAIVAARRAEMLQEPEVVQ